MKAIVATGWTPSLIPDDYIKNAFLADGLNEISALEITLAEAESDLAEKLEQVEMDDEDEDNGNTIKTAKAYLKEQITGLGSAGTDSAQKEQSSLAALLASLENTEKTVKALRKSINKAKENLDLQVEVKRKTFAEGEARQLILQKFRDTARDKMYQYLNAELKRLIGVFENLWDKYRVSFDDISLARNESVKGVVGSLDSLGYVEHK
jgi:type I restriction enzyme M protein